MKMLSKLKPQNEVVRYKNKLNNDLSNIRLALKTSLSGLRFIQINERMDRLSKSLDMLIQKRAAKRQMEE
jgi:hypothetical protein